MEQNSVFEFNSYKKYLDSTLEFRSRQHGRTRATLARAINCEAAYISQVLKGERHLNLEQAEAVNRFLQHNDDERRIGI